MYLKILNYYYVKSFKKCPKKFKGKLYWNSETSILRDSSPNILVISVGHRFFQSSCQVVVILMFLYSDVLQCHHIREYQAAEACAGVCVRYSSSPGKFDPNHPVSEPPDWRLRGLCDRGWHRCLSSMSLILVCLSEQLLLWQHEFWFNRGYQDLFIFLFSLFYNLLTASSIFRISFLLEE